MGQIQYQPSTGPLPLPDEPEIRGPGVGGGGVPRRPVFVGYQALADPLFQPPAPVTPDTGWLTAPVDVVRRRVQVARSDYVGPVLVPDVTQPVTPNSWDPSYPDRVPGRRPQPWAAPQVAPPFVPDVTQPVPALSWKPTFDDRVVRLSMRAGLQQSLAWPVFTPDVTQPVPPLSWAPSYPDWVFRLKFRTALQQATAAPYFVADVTDPAPLLSWQPRHPDRIPRGIYLVALQQFLALNATTPTPVVVPDLAVAVYPDRVYGRPPLRQQDWLVEPLYVPDVTVVAPDYKAPTYPDFISRRRMLAAQQQFLALPTFVPDVTNPVPDLSWQPSYPDRYRRLVMPVAQQQFLAWGLLFPAPVPAPDLVVTIGPSPATRKRFILEGGGVAPLYVPDVTVVVPHLSWKPQFPDRITRPKMLASEQQTLGWAVDTPVTPGTGQPPGCVSP